MKRARVSAPHGSAPEERQAASRLVSAVVEILCGRYAEQAQALAIAHAPANSVPADAGSRVALPQPDHGGAAAGRHLDAALSAARRCRPGLARAITAIAEGLAWTQTEAYVSEPPYPGFLDHYAHAALLGPGDLAPMLATRTADVRLGLLLLGPAHAYPPHAHPAEEIYLPLSAARWTNAENRRPRRLPGGTLIHHAPGVAHGIQTEEDALIAVYLWLGDTRTSSRFTGES